MTSHMSSLQSFFLLAPEIILVAAALIAFLGGAFAGLRSGWSVAVVGILAAMLVAGLSWIVVAVNHNVSVQMCSPDWVRGRAISFYLITFQGSLAIGSWISGWVAAQAGIAVSVTLCGVLCGCGVFLIPFFPLTRPPLRGSNEIVS